MKRVNWPQAFAEIGLLVIGGVLALGGDAWMDARRDLETEHAYLLSLRDDFEETRELTWSPPGKRVQGDWRKRDDS